MKKLTTKQITMGAALLAICIISQFLKNTSVFITGPIINACLIICEVCVGFIPAIILSIITPVTSFIITGSPIMSAVPLIIPFIMLGNVVLILFIHLLNNKVFKNAPANISFAVSMVIASIVKALFMGISISYIILPTMLPEPMLAKLPILQAQFSTTQLITTLIGSVLAYIIMIPLRKVINED